MASPDSLIPVARKASFEIVVLVDPDGSLPALVIAIVWFPGQPLNVVLAL